MRGQGADAQDARGLVFPHVGKPGNAPDVDDMGRLDQPQLHQRHQALSAGQELGTLPRALEEVDGLVHGFRNGVVEGGRVHGVGEFETRASRQEIVSVLKSQPRDIRR